MFYRLLADECSSGFWSGVALNPNFGFISQKTLDKYTPLAWSEEKVSVMMSKESQSQLRQLFSRKLLSAEQWYKSNPNYAQSDEDDAADVADPTYEEEDQLWDDESIVFSVNKFKLLYVIVLVLSI